MCFVCCEYIKLIQHTVLVIKKNQRSFTSVFVNLFQPFSIKHFFNVVSMLKQQLSLFQPYFNVEGWSCAGWFSTVQH